MKLLFPSNSLGATPSRSQAFFCFARWLFLICLACSSCLSGLGQKADDAALELKRGKMLYSKHDLTGAVASYSKAIAMKPDLAIAYVRRGFVRWMQGDVDKAVEDFDKAMELDPDSMRDDLSVADAYVSHGSARRNNLQIEPAIADYDKAIKLSPRRTDSYLQRGQARLLNEDLTGAIVDFDYFIANEKHDSFSRALAFADRSLAKRLLGKTLESRIDMQESMVLMKGKEHIVEEQVEELTTQLLILRQMRARDRKIIASAWRPS
jgi:tetratricopeptide (TPR) repeat protein